MLSNESINLLFENTLSYVNNAYPSIYSKEDVCKLLIELQNRMIDTNNLLESLNQ